MSDELDPEVLADLQLRASSECDSTRTRGARYDWTTPKAVEAWTCRNPRCRASVLVTQDAIDALRDANSIAKSKGWEPLNEGEVVMCSDCRALFEKYAHDRQAEIRECTREVIAQLKGGATQVRVRRKDGIHTCNEREALDQLHRWGHPDVRALEYALEEKRNGKHGERRSKL